MGNRQGHHGVVGRRTSKDSVFCDLFSQGDYLLELYRVLHPEDVETTADDLEIVTIERVVTDGEYNDLGFMAGNRLLVLVEAQSTWSANIVTRMLLYLAETYRRRIRGMNASLHETAPVLLPAPELYVVYTGNRDVPETVKLSDVTVDGTDGDVDVSVRVLRGGRQDVVGEYVAFTEVFDQVRVNDSVPPGRKPAEVVRQCLERGILAAYMERRRLEVEDIMFTLFDQEYETELYHKRLEKQLTEKLRRKITEEVTQDVTEAITRDVTERVTRDVTEQVTRDVTEEATSKGRDEGMAAAVVQLAKAQGLTIDEAMTTLAVPKDNWEAIASLAMAS